MQRMTLRSETGERTGKRNHVPTHLRAQGRSYADVLFEIRCNANPKETGTDIKILKKTRCGDTLFQLWYNIMDKVSFSSKLKETTVEIIDLGCLIAVWVIREAVKKSLGKCGGELKVSAIDMSSSGPQRCHRPAERAPCTGSSEGRVNADWLDEQ